MTPQARIIERDNSSTWILNRTMFHSTLKKAFEQWIVNLRASNPTLRENMRRRMDEIISKQHAF